MLNVKEVKNELPHSAIPDYEKTAKIFHKAEEEGYDEAIVVSVSTGLGGTANFLRLLCEKEVPKMKVFIVDSRIACFPEGALALRARQLVDQGVPTEDILKELEWMKARQELVGLDEKLDYLIYNGRLKGAKAYMGKMLKVTPIIAFNREGELTSYAKERGIKSACKEMVNIVKTKIIAGRDPSAYWLGHIYTGTSTLEILKKFEEVEGLKTNHEDVIMDPVSGINNGPWCAGYFYVPLRQSNEDVNDLNGNPLF